MFSVASNTYIFLKKIDVKQGNKEYLITFYFSMNNILKLRDHAYEKSKVYE